MNDTLPRIPAQPTADKIDEAFPLEVKETIEHFRKRMNLSRRELAELASITQSQVWRMEHITDAADVDANVGLWIKIWDALNAFEGENPSGKPKAAKTTKPMPAAYRDVKAHKVDLEDLKEEATQAVAAMKAKKVSTTHVKMLLGHIEEMIAKLDEL